MVRTFLRIRIEPKCSSIGWTKS